MCLDPNWCISCKSSNEDLDHLFIHYPKAQKLWQLWSTNTGISIEICLSLCKIKGSNCKKCHQLQHRRCYLMDNLVRKKQTNLHREKNQSSKLLGRYLLSNRQLILKKQIVQALQLGHSFIKYQCFLLFIYVNETRLCNIFVTRWLLSSSLHFTCIFSKINK